MASNTTSSPRVDANQDQMNDTPTTVVQDMDDHQVNSSKTSQTRDWEPPPSAQEEDQWISGMRLLSVTSAITVACFLVLLDATIVATAIPRITNQFHSLADIGWYGGAYQLASAALQLLTGKLYTHFSSKWTFMAFFALFELGSLICGVANSSTMLIVGRAVAGMGASGIVNGAFTIVAGCVPMERRPSLVGLLMGISTMGLVMGPLIGGALTEYTSWRWCFYINLPTGGVAAAMIALARIPDQTPKEKASTVARTIHTKLDLIGFAIFAPAAIQALLALQYGGIHFPWNSLQVIGLFCGAGATFVVFLAWEYHAAEKAMIPLSLVRQRRVWTSCLVYGFLLGQSYATIFYLPVYFQAVRGASPLMSGVYLLPGILGQMFAAVASGALVQRIGYFTPLSIISSVMISIANGLLSTFTPGTSTGKWIGYQILLGVGRGLGLQMPILAVQNTLPPSQIAIAMALLQFSNNFLGAIYLTLSEVIFTSGLKSNLAKYAPNVDYRTVIDAGATKFSELIDKAELHSVLVAYAKSVDEVFYFAAAGGVVCFVFGWGMGWVSLKKKKLVEEEKGGDKA